MRLLAMLRLLKAGARYAFIIPGCMTSAVALECSGQGGGIPIYSQADDVKVAVLRFGTLIQDNPLRPMSNEILSIWRITVNGKPGFLRRMSAESFDEISSPEELEYMSSRSVTWGMGLSELPVSILIVTRSRSVVGPLTLSGCEQRPVSPASNPAGTLSGGRTNAKYMKPTLPRVQLPQGAIPE